ncbi:7152_t:CDS:2, partial [Acaulospora colombiana]
SMGDNNEGVGNNSAFTSGSGTPFKAEKPKTSNQTTQKKGIKKLTFWRDSENAENYKVVFHVHLPEGIADRDGLGFPVVVGNIDELGKWKDPIVKLKLKKRKENFMHSLRTYWVSDQISIPITSFNEEIRYRYGFFIPRKEEKKDKSKKDDKEKDKAKDNKNDDKRKGNDKESKKGEKSGEGGGILESERDGLLERYPDYTKCHMTLKFIDEKLRETKPKDRLFLYVLLGYYIKSRTLDSSLPHHYQIHPAFPSSLLLECLEKFNPDRLPEDAHGPFLIATNSLVYHNAYYSLSFDWLKVFSLASSIDPQYRFIDLLVDREFNSETKRKLLEKLPKHVMPYINDIEENTYAKIAQWLIQMYDNVDLSYIWKDVIRHTERIDELIRQPFLDRIQANISDIEVGDLIKFFETIPKDFQNGVEEAFRTTILNRLERVYISWTWKSASDIFSVFQKPEFKWTAEDLISALDRISQSTDLNLLDIFPDLLKHLFNFENSSKKMLQILTEYWHGSKD